MTAGYANNRLHSTSLPAGAWAHYGHDPNGNMTSTPHLALIEYTHRDQMRHADLGGGGDAYYTYDAAGERVRKFIQRIGTTTEERIYLDGWELYRKRTGAGQAIEIERETLHLTDGTRRIALVETLTVDKEASVPHAVPRIRYQYGNHLDSAMLECDPSGAVISYEEYHPYGTAAYRSARSGVEVSERRYRYTGKERDEETGFGYHSARYYASWLGRWTSADPAGMVDGPCLYGYCRGSPTALTDVSGRQGNADLENLTSSADPVQNISGGWIGQKSEDSPWFVQACEEEELKSQLSRSIRSMKANVANERVAQGRAPDVDFASVDQIQRDISSLIAYNNAVWEANEALRQASEARRQYLMQQEARQYEWSASGEGGAPPEDWIPPEKPLIPGTGEHLGTLGREVLLIAATSGRGTALAGLRPATSGASPIVASSSGKPMDIALGGGKLSGGQRRLLASLPDSGAETVVRKRSVSMTDLAAMTAETGDEFAMLTRRGERLIIRGNSSSLPTLSVARAEDLAAQGWRWSGHIHPGITPSVLWRSAGDEAVLMAFARAGRPARSVIFNSTGRFRVFDVTF